MPPTHAVGSSGVVGCAAPGGAVVEGRLRRATDHQAQRRRSRDVLDPPGIAPVAPRSELAEKAEACRAVLVAAQGVGQVGVDKTQDGGGRSQRRVIRRRLRRRHDEPGEGDRAADVPVGSLGQVGDGAPGWRQGSRVGHGITRLVGCAQRRPDPLHLEERAGRDRERRRVDLRRAAAEDGDRLGRGRRCGHRLGSGGRRHIDERVAHPDVRSGHGRADQAAEHDGRSRTSGPDDRDLVDRRR